MKSIRNQIFKILGMLQPYHLQKFAIMLWCIWRRRNEKLWDDLDTAPNISVSLSLQFLYEWLQESCAINSSSSQFYYPMEQASNTVSSSSMWTQQVLRTSNTSVCLNLAREAEALGLFHAISWAQDMNHPQVIFESDCKSLVDGIYSSQKGSSEFHLILASLKGEFYNHKRQTNEVVHSLVKTSRFYTCIQFGDISNCINPLDDKK
ncbi:hypothetical protein GmHk_20G059123 [Glycine max]|nr:hypothetical protein GmHk_20G059123 [Glycine max]